MLSTGQPPCRFLAIDVPRGTGFPSHQHPVHQFLSVERGALAVRTATSHWAVPSRSGVWLAADLDHELLAIEDASVAFAYVGSATDWPAPATGVVAIRPLLREAVIALARPAAVSGPRRVRLEAVFLDELADLEPASFLVLLPVDPAARAVADQLLAHPDDGRPIEELGRSVGAGTRTLQRRFRAETGLTFQAWRRRARVQCAMGQLTDGVSVTAAAHECGFSSASAFIHAFRTETGCTPAGWRRQLDDGSAGPTEGARSGASSAGPAAS